MAKKIDAITKIKKALEEETLVIGTEEITKLLKKGTLQDLFITSNCPSSVKAELTKYAELAKVEVNELELDNEELGVVCKKPYSIAVAGIIKK